MKPNLRMVTTSVLLSALAATAAAADIAAERTTLFRLDKAWAAAAAAKDVEKIVSFCADTATVIPPGQPAVVGKEALRQYVKAALALPGFSITWETTEFVVAASGDLAYGLGTNAMSFRDPQGNPVTQRARAITVWRKGPDGNWKCVVDTWNTEPAAQK